jgi:ribosomal protein S18 acetylase RimI-like enzyme
MILREAEAADVPFIMACERRPGYLAFVGRWEEPRHREAMADKAYRYFVTHDEIEARGYFMLHQSDLWPTSLYLKRAAMFDTDKGHGRGSLVALNDWVFANTETHRFWLDVAINNARARHLYESLGFEVEGTLREVYVEPDGRRSSSIQMSLLRPDWLGRPK